MEDPSSGLAGPPNPPQPDPQPSKNKRLFLRGTRLFPADLTSFDSGKEAGANVSVRLPPKMLDAVQQMTQHFQSYSGGPKTTSHFVRNAVMFYWRQLKDYGLLDGYAECDLLEDMRVEFEQERAATTRKKRHDAINNTFRHLKASVSEMVAGGQFADAADEVNKVLGGYNTDEYRKSSMYPLVVAQVYNDFQFTRDLEFLERRGFRIELPPKADYPLEVIEGGAAGG